MLIRILYGILKVNVTSNFHSCVIINVNIGFIVACPNQFIFLQLYNFGIRAHSVSWGVVTLTFP